MNITTDEKYIEVFQALSSTVRLKIINLLSKKPMNVKDIANSLQLSTSITTMHINKLEIANLIECKREKIKSGTQKLCTLKSGNITIEFPRTNSEEINFHEFNLPVGHYTDFSVEPTCGLSTIEKIIGMYDDPRYFLSPERVNIGILWFSKGYVEYKIPNYLLSNETPEKLEITMELSSEAPSYNTNWPSNITFFFNGINVGNWLSPGDFADKKGKFTPSWWNPEVNQYGLLKVLTIDNTGTYIDGQKISNVNLDDVQIKLKTWTFRLAVLNDSPNVGGLTIFGKGFGNYNQDINFKLFYINE